MKAIILVAGEGTRLRPLTEDRPKCLVELCGVSLLDRQIATFANAGVSDITVVTGYRAEKIVEKGYKAIFNPDYNSTNMVESLFCASKLMTGETDLIVSYGDIVYEDQVLSSLIECEAPVCIAVDANWRDYWKLRLEEPLEDAETLKLDPRGLILELGKKPKGYNEIEGQYTGLIKIRSDHQGPLKEVYGSLDRKANYDGGNFRNMFMTSFIQHLIEMGWAVQAVLIKNGWLEVDTLEDLNLYHQMHEDGTLSKFCRLD